MTLMLVDEMTYAPRWLRVVCAAAVVLEGMFARTPVVPR